MGQIVIAVYQPKPGQREALEALVADHVARLRKEGLVTDRAPIIMSSKNDAIVEVFEWVSEAAIEAAHKNPAVIEMWGEFSQLCDYVPISNCPEALQMFSEFSPLN